MNKFKPVCPDFEAKDCPFSCCVFLCLLAKHSRSKAKSEKKQHKKSLKYSTNSIGNTTASTVDGENNVPTRVSSQTNLNNSNCTGSNENLTTTSETNDGDLIVVDEQSTRTFNSEGTQV